jgi:hypothetical protein
MLPCARRVKRLAVSQVDRDVILGGAAALLGELQQAQTSP